MTDAEYEVVFEKFKAARMIFIKYLRVHSNSTRQDLIDGLGWYPEKVDIFLDLLIRMGMAIPSPSSSGETRYQFEELFVALRRKHAQQEKGRLETPRPSESEEPPDYIALLIKKGLL